MAYEVILPRSNPMPRRIAEFRFVPGVPVAFDMLDDIPEMIREMAERGDMLIHETKATKSARKVKAPKDEPAPVKTESADD